MEKSKIQIMKRERVVRFSKEKDIQRCEKVKNGQMYKKGDWGKPQTFQREPSKIGGSF